MISFILGMLAGIFVSMFYSAVTEQGLMPTMTELVFRAWVKMIEFFVWVRKLVGRK